MMVQITARHIEVPASLKSYIERRVAKLDKFIDGITDVHVTLTTEKFRQIAELNVHSRGNTYMSATEVTEDLKSSVTLAIEKIESQAKKHRAKRIDKKRRRSTKADGAGTFEVLVPDTQRQRTPEVIESGRFVVKPMAIEEAVMQLEEEKAEFLVFRNEHGRTNVLYRRPDGNFGLIDPE